MNRVEIIILYIKTVNYRIGNKIDGIMVFTLFTFH